MAATDHDRVREVFQQVVELSPENRVAYLQRECRDDADQRAAVERLLKHHHPNTLLLESEKEVSEQEKRQMDTKELAAKPDRNRTRRFEKTLAEPVRDPAIGMLRRHSQSLPRLSRQRRLLLGGGGVGLLLLIMLGWWLHAAIQNSLANSLQIAMREMLDHQIRALENWLETEEELIASWARLPGVVEAIDDLNRVSHEGESSTEALRSSPSARQLSKTLDTVTVASGKFSYAVWNREGTLVADSSAEGLSLIGNGTTEYGASLLARVFQGETVLWMPSRAGFITQGFELTGETSKGNLALIAPVYNKHDKRPVAAILMSHRSRQQRFEDMLQAAEFGVSGEVYAFADDGYLISENRFLKQLRQVGLVPNSPDAFSAQVVRVADPGGNLLDGFVSKLDRGEWPLTRAVTAAVSGLDGSDIDGYRDYRGIEVVGVWSWLPRYRFGIIAEVDHAYAYGPMVPLQRTFGIIFAALIISALAAVAASLAFLRLRQRSPVSTIGPYTLKSLLGEGGFAHVYLATHALLKRPTAIKILKPEQINEKNLSRFEREVQLASGLSHPNTINIYDYGATDDGSFYYAMEYIKGLSLQELIELDGPQCPARAMWILEQICKSLREAHHKGLIHRDIKPQNIMLCRRGGEYDFVKVLDFGLARSMETEQNRVTETKLLIGTPHYIAPERIVDPTCMDPRSDIYSLGILGFFLLTGREPFEAQGSMDALAQTINGSARRPSEQTSSPIPPRLDQLIRDCHSRVITERPQTIEDVLDRLQEVELEVAWNAKSAAAWWAEHQRKTLDEVNEVLSVAQSRNTMSLSPPAGT
jgi:eukaryotic-like serine/threonine-protein kinase